MVSAVTRPSAPPSSAWSASSNGRAECAVQGSLQGALVHRAAGVDKMRRRGGGSVTGVWALRPSPRCHAPFSADQDGGTPCATRVSAYRQLLLRLSSILF